MGLGMIKAVFQINELDCESCVEFLVNKLHKKKLIENYACEKCKSISFCVNNEQDVKKIQKVIHNFGFDIDLVTVNEIKTTINKSHNC